MLLLSILTTKSYPPIFEATYNGLQAFAPCPFTAAYLALAAAYEQETGTPLPPT